MTEFDVDVVEEEPPSTPSAFAEALQMVLDAVPDRALAAKLEIVYRGADACVGQLRSVELARFEIDDVEGSADLGLFEEVAPAVGQIMSHISNLIALIGTHFPPETNSSLGNALDESLAEMGIGSMVTNNVQAADAVRRGADALRVSVGQFGMGVRNPEVVGSRWALLSHLQGGMGRFTNIISDLVHESALAFSEIPRSMAVPYHAEQLKESLTLRRAMVDLSRVATLYVEKLKNAVLSEMPPLLQRLERDLNSFAKTTAYKSLWAKDKKEMLEHRRNLRSFADNPVDAELLRQAVGEFAEFIARLGAVNERAILKEHDREVSATCAARLEQAVALGETSTEDAGAIMTDVIREAWALYGRDPEFDAYLRKVKKRGSVSFTPADLRVELDVLTTLISRVPLTLLE